MAQGDGQPTATLVLRHILEQPAVVIENALFHENRGVGTPHAHRVAVDRVAIENDIAPEDDVAHHAAEVLRVQPAESEEAVFYEHVGHGGSIAGGDLHAGAGLVSLAVFGLLVDAIVRRFRVDEATVEIEREHHGMADSGVGPADVDARGSAHDQRPGGVRSVGADHEGLRRRAPVASPQAHVMPPVAPLEQYPVGLAVAGVLERLVDRLEGPDGTGGMEGIAADGRVAACVDFGRGIIPFAVADVNQPRVSGRPDQGPTVLIQRQPPLWHGRVVGRRGVPVGGSPDRGRQGKQNNGDV